MKQLIYLKDIQFHGLNYQASGIKQVRDNRSATKRIQDNLPTCTQLYNTKYLQLASAKFSGQEVKCPLKEWA